MPIYGKLMFQGSETALIYHPSASEDICASMEICTESGGHWVTASLSNNYVNFESQEQLDRFIANANDLQYEMPYTRREEELKEQIRELQKSLAAALKE